MRLLFALVTLAPLAADSAIPERDPRPVLFVHGYGLNATTWSRMMKELERRGYPREYLQAVEIVPDDRSNVDAAKAVLRPAARDLLRRAGRAAERRGVLAPEAIDIVAHSMGAVSARWYAARLDPERVGIWIGIAGANHGTNALCRFRRTPGGSEMCPAFARSAARSVVQVTLNGTAERRIDESPYGLGEDRATPHPVPADALRRIAYFTIRIEPDVWIRPSSSALLDGAGTGMSISLRDLRVEERPSGNFIVKDESDHDALPANPGVIELVWRLLSNSDISDSVRRRHDAGP